MTDPLDTLESHLAGAIPAAAHMGLRVVRYEGGALVLGAPLEPNVNVHGTGFAGSLYALAALAGWGLLFLRLAADDLAGKIVIVRGQVTYVKPVTDEFEAACRVDEDEYAQFRQVLNRRHSAKIDLDALVRCRGEPAVRFEGQYLVTMTG